MKQTMSGIDLVQENKSYFGSGAVSQEIRCMGYAPAFMDAATGKVYPSRDSEGRPAMVHQLQGLPDEVVLERDAAGWVTVVKPTLVSGFLHDGIFYTREQCAERLRCAKLATLVVA